MEIRITLMLWVSIFSRQYGQINSGYTGVDIGHKCKYDAECTTGNGGEYSKCNRDLNICICTINHLGKDKCNDSDNRRQTFFKEMEQCTLECSPTEARKWKENEDWYGDIEEHFASFIHDKKTSVCYDPVRALNSLPDGLEVKQSTIPNAGLGVFTNVYIEQGTVFGPYKGTFQPDTDDEQMAAYGWKVWSPECSDADDVMVDGKDVAQSNWMRYSNTPVSASMENFVAIQYEEEVYYQAFKNIQPGTELLVWYGRAYDKYLNIETFERPRHHYAKPGYAGGRCSDEDEGTQCEHDENTVCADEKCFCLPGTHIRAGICVIDETLGGVCTGSDGETCKQDTNTECQGGVCVCKYSTLANGMCIPDETFGGRCAARNGERCLQDNNAECVNGLCRCRYGTTGINGKCVEDETFGGRCAVRIGQRCLLDNNTECVNNLCKCRRGATEINGKCVEDAKDQSSCYLRTTTVKQE